MLAIKGSAVRFRMSRAIQQLLVAISEVSDSPVLDGMPLMITSMHDSLHMKTSRHYTDEAIDLRTRLLTPAQRSWLLTALRTRLPSTYTVLLEDEGGPNEHLHLQVRQGEHA